VLEEIMSEEQPKICPFMSEPSQIAWNDAGIRVAFLEAAPVTTVCVFDHGINLHFPVDPPDNDCHALHRSFRHGISINSPGKYPHVGYISSFHAI